MVEIKNKEGNVLFSFNENETTLAKEIGNHKNLAGADLRGADLAGANLKYADLKGADLGGANLKGADLPDTDIRDANLKGADLFCADLWRANLESADLANADLRGANLESADLANADLWGANLKRATFYEANLEGADLEGADIRFVNFRWANLSGANLEGADLWGADLCGAENVPDIPLACPSEGSFIAWKKVNNYLVKLEIPADAKRSSAMTNKCRCDKALVLDIEDLATGEHPSVVVNRKYCECVYEVGKMVYPDWFDENRWYECSHGIHFFVNRLDAINF